MFQSGYMLSCYWVFWVLTFGSNMASNISSHFIGCLSQWNLFVYFYLMKCHFTTLAFNARIFSSSSLKQQTLPNNNNNNKKEPKKHFPSLTCEGLTFTSLVHCSLTFVCLVGEWAFSFISSHVDISCTDIVYSSAAC